jgi:hypothetical protein
MRARALSRVVVDRVDESERVDAEAPPGPAWHVPGSSFWLWIAVVVACGGLAIALSVTLMSRVAPP